MTWGAPERLWWLAMLPLAAIGLSVARAGFRRRLGRLVAPPLWPVLLPTWRVGRARARDALRLGAAAFLLLALARPQWGFRWEEVRQRSLQIMVVLDVSNSMRASDLPPNRLQQAKWGVRDLIRQLQGDRIGLVVFAGSAFLQCPLTSDYAAFLLTLDDVYPGVIPRGGTAIARGLREAMTHFDDEGDSDRVIVLITDGEDHEEDPVALVPTLKEKGIRVYVVGVGTLEGELIAMPDGSFLKDREGRVVKTRLVEEPLMNLAMKTGGAYVRAVPGDFGLEHLYRDYIRRLTRHEHEERLVKVPQEQFGWFVLGAWLWLAAEALIAPASRPIHAIIRKKPRGE